MTAGETGEGYAAAPVVRPTREVLIGIGLEALVNIISLELDWLVEIESGVTLCGNLLSDLCRASPRNFEDYNLPGFIRLKGLGLGLGVMSKLGGNR